MKVHPSPASSSKDTSEAQLALSATLAPHVGHVVLDLVGSEHTFVTHLVTNESRKLDGQSWVEVEDDGYIVLVNDIPQGDLPHAVVPLTEVFKKQLYVEDATGRRMVFPKDGPSGSGRCLDTDKACHREARLTTRLVGNASSIVELYVFTLVRAGGLRVYWSAPPQSWRPCGESVIIASLPTFDLIHPGMRCSCGSTVF